MKRAQVFYVVIFIILLIIVGTILFIYFNNKKDKFSSPELNLLDLEKGGPLIAPESKVPAGKVPAGKVPANITNPGKNLWQIYNHGIQVGDATEDYAQALICLPSKGVCKVPPLESFESFRTVHHGPYSFEMTSDFAFEFIAVLTFGDTFNLNGRNVGRYISFFTILVPHYDKLRRNEVNILCKTEKIFVEGETAVIEASLWASVGDLEKRASISVKGGGDVKIIF